MQEEPFVSIVIPSYNSSQTILKTIAACLEQEYPKDKIEILVVDDGSTDDTKTLLKKCPVKYIYQERKGPANARNTGWINANGEAVIFIDGDCVPEKDLIKKLLVHYDKKDTGAIAGSYSKDGFLNLLDRFVHLEIKYRHKRMPLYINSFGTYNVLIKRHVLDTLTGFDATFRNASGEDSDLAYRIVKAGYGIYFEKDALVSHKNRLGFIKYLLIQFRHGYWRLKLYKKDKDILIRDDYRYWKDLIEVPVALFILLLLLVGFLVKGISLLLLISAIILLLIQIPLIFNIVKQEKDIRYLGFIFVTFIRAFVRVSGGIFGFVSFWVLEKPDNIILWDNFWKKYIFKNSWCKKRMQRVIEPYLRKGINVLDLGCGSGFLSQFFISRGCYAYAMDYSKEALALARRLTDNKAKMYIQGDILDIQCFKGMDEKFDIICTDGLLEHYSWDEQKRIISNMKLVKKEDGIILNFVPNKFSYWTIFRPFFLRIEEHSFYMDRFLELHKINDLKILTSGGFNAMPFRFSPERLLGGSFGMLLYCVAK